MGGSGDDSHGWGPDSYMRDLHGAPNSQHQPSPIPASLSLSLPRQHLSLYLWQEVTMLHTYTHTCMGQCLAHLLPRVCQAHMSEKRCQHGTYSLHVSMQEMLCTGTTHAQVFGMCWLLSPAAPRGFRVTRTLAPELGGLQVPLCASSLWL